MFFYSASVTRSEHDHVRIYCMIHKSLKQAHQTWGPGARSGPAKTPIRPIGKCEGEHLSFTKAVFLYHVEKQTYSWNCTSFFLYSNVLGIQCFSVKKFKVKVGCMLPTVYNECDNSDFIKKGLKKRWANDVNFKLYAITSRRGACGSSTTLKVKCFPFMVHFWLQGLHCCPFSFIMFRLLQNLS